MLINFNSNCEVIGQMPSFSEQDIKNEKMFFRADKEFIEAHAGPITKCFISLVPDDWKNSFVLDSLVHMLMPGMYPCIPGWHLDDVPRTRPDGQPNHASPEYQSEHIMCVVGDCSLTSFALGSFSLKDIPIGGGTVYSIWHKEIEGMIYNNKINERVIKSGEIVKFNWQSFHKGNSTTHRGWRYFVRITKGTKLHPKNEIRNQVQVYMPDPFTGW